jgi:hypothetical protein
MQRRFIVIDYDPERYRFGPLLAGTVFKVPCLARLHEDRQRKTGRALLDYQDNLALRKLMQELDDAAPFYRLYHRWIAEVLAPHYASRIRYSAHPKMRVHLAGTGSVSDFHCDADVTGRPEQINCFLPFTDVFDSCTLHVESEYGKGDYGPVNLRYGQALLWDGGFLRHGTVANTSGHTRVSGDFRFHAKQADLVRSPWRDVLADRPSHQRLPSRSTEHA